MPVMLELTVEDPTTGSPRKIQVGVPHGKENDQDYLGMAAEAYLKAHPTEDKKPEDPGFLGTLGNAAKGLIQSIPGVRAITNAHVPTSIGDAVGQVADGASSVIPGDPLGMAKQAYRAVTKTAPEVKQLAQEGHPVQAALHGAAAVVPGGEQAEEAGTQFGLGHTGAGIANAGLAAGPYLAPVAAEALHVVAPRLRSPVTFGEPRLPSVSTIRKNIGWDPGRSVVSDSVALPYEVARQTVGRATLRSPLAKVERAAPAWRSIKPDIPIAAEETPLSKPVEFPSGRKVGGETRPVEAPKPKETISVNKTKETKAPDAVSKGEEAKGSEQPKETEDAQSKGSNVITPEMKSRYDKLAVTDYKHASRIFHKAFKDEGFSDTLRREFTKKLYGKESSNDMSKYEKLHAAEQVLGYELNDDYFGAPFAKGYGINSSKAPKE